MIDDLKTDLDKENNPDEKRKLESKISACNALIEMEQKEGLSPVSKRLYGR
jgi:hypothetical protein